MKSIGTLAGSAALLAAGCCLASACGAEGAVAGAHSGAYDVPRCAMARPLDPMVPVNPDMSDAKTLAADLRSARERWGLRRFVLTGPHAVNTQFNRTDVDAYRRLGERLAEVRGHLAGTDIEIGWWLAPTLRQGRDVPGQHVVDCEGHVSDAVCPLDPGFEKRITEGIAAACSVGRPFIVFFEDDYELAWHRGMNGLGGCFCGRHLALFAEKFGARLSAAEVAAAFRSRTAENEPLRRAFAEAQKASLVAFAQAIRRAIDGVDPSIRTCLCQSYRVDIDGDTTEAIARALAGGTRPAVRVYGARYNNENQAEKLPQTLAHTAWSAATLPKDVELFHESDPYPHNRFFSAASFLGSEIACAFMCGVGDSYLYCSQYLDDPFEDGGYADWFSRNRRRLEAVRDFRAKARPVGVRVSFDPKEHYLVREAAPGRKLDFLADGAYFLGKLGFPYTAVGGDVTILSAQSVEQLADDALRRALSGGVLLDGAAALALSKRGFDSLTGVAPAQVDRLPATKERILPAAGCRRRGKNVNCWLLDPVGGVEASVLLKLSPLPGAEAWAEYAGPDGETVAPSITYFENSLGGRVAVLSQGLSGNRSSGIYSPRKQELFANLFGRLSRGRLDVCAPETPCTWVLACVSEDGGEMLVMVDNLAGEVRDDVALRLSEKWRGAAVARLAPDGAWQPLGKTEDQTWRPAIPFQHMSPEFFRLSR
ncbi:MAG: hypothetical protein IKE55_10010 [Kiritimatiellae bacterium]|nr:hypothetical protein [Kiritimatiellia bacterium]